MCVPHSGFAPGQLSMMAKDILRNIKHYATSLHAKLIRKQANHGSTSQKDLVSLGRRLISPDFLFFTCLFEDIMAACVRPFALVVQNESEEPWLTHLRFKQLLIQLGDACSQLRRLRRWLFVTSLLQHYCTKTELTSFVFAHLYTSFGRAFPATMGKVSSLLLKREFGDVKVQVLADLQPGHHCLCPRCTCGARRFRDPRKRVKLCLSRRDGSVISALVPQYVAGSKLTTEQTRVDIETWKKDPLDFQPRRSA